MSFSFVNVIFVGLISLLSVNLDYWPGTTLNLQFIFLGRCRDYQSILQKSRDSLKDLKAAYNCLDVWTKFKDSFARKDPCKITLNDYNDFFAMVNSGPIAEKVSCNIISDGPSRETNSV